jgi:hypothetical protein
MLPTLPSADLDIRPLLGKRVRAAKASFYLGVLLFLAAFVGFAFFGLGRLPISVPVAALAGFFAGLYFLLMGLVWASLWALIIQLHALWQDLAGWAAETLSAAMAQIRLQFTSGVVVDLAVVEHHIDLLVAAQTERWSDDAWVPVVREWAPPIAKQGLKYGVTRLAGNFWQEETRITVADLERKVADLNGVTVSRSLRRILGIATFAWLGLAALLVGAPFALTFALGWFF